MPSQIGYFDTLKSVTGKVFTYLASITLTGTDGKIITVTQDTSLDDTVALSKKANLETANSFTNIAPMTTLAESWIGPSSTAGVYFKTGSVGIGKEPITKLHVFDTNRVLSSGASNLSILTTDAQAIDTGGILGLGGLADVNIDFAKIVGRKENSTAGNRDGYFTIAPFLNGTGNVERLRVTSIGKVGIGKLPDYQLELSLDSAGKPGTGGLWTVVSDERIKTDITFADLNRCYEIVKSIPLKRFAWADGVYTEEQVKDRHNLGWIAQDVQKVFDKAVDVKPFTKGVKIPDGVEEYEEQDFTLETVEKEETSIEVRNGVPTQVKKTVKSEKKVILFDTVDVVDEHGSPVMNGDEPLTYQVPKMIKKTRPKFRQDVIEDCLDLNNGQLYAAMYGCIQKLMQKVEALESQRSL